MINTGCQKLSKEVQKHKTLTKTQFCEIRRLLCTDDFATKNKTNETYYMTFEYWLPKLMKIIS